jgi:arginase
MVNESKFGIDDCHKPRINNKRTYRFSMKLRNNKTRRINRGGNSIDNFILFSHSLGQSRGGVEKAPAYLSKHISKKRRNIQSVDITDDMVKNINNLYDVNKKITGARVNIGGDHSMSIATIANTLNNFKNAKIIYFDAHADINTYASSGSKHYHGMPLSFVTGLDKDRNNDFPFIGKKLKYSNILYIGSRCWDVFEADEIYKRNIKFIDPDDINNNYKASLNKILDFVGDSPLHVSFDVDSIDPGYIPSTGTPVKNGILLNNAIHILEALKTKNLVNVDITELNMKIGSASDIKKSSANTVKLFNMFLKR